MKLMELYEEMKNDLIRSNFRNKKGIIMCLGHYDIRFKDFEKELKQPKTQGIPAKKYNALVKKCEALEKENLDLLEAMADHDDSPSE